MEDDHAPPVVVTKKEMLIQFGAACRAGDLASVVTLWQQTKEDYDIINEYGVDGVAPIHWASYNGHIKVVRFLLLKNVNVNAKLYVESYCTALQWAGGAGRTEIVRLLLDHGADPMLVDSMGYTALAHCAQGGHTLLIHLIWSKDRTIDMNHRDTSAHTLVHWAAYKNHIVCLKYLVEVHKIDVNALDQHKRTGLHWAARKGWTDICRYLVERGCGLYHKDEENFTPLEWAKSNGHEETAEFLERAQGGPGRGSAQNRSSSRSSQPDEENPVAMDTRSPPVAPPANTWKTSWALRHDREQRNKALLSAFIMFIVYYFLSAMLPPFITLFLGAAYITVPASALVALVKSQPKEQRQTGTTTPNIRTRNLGITAAFVCFMIIQAINVFRDNGLLAFGVVHYPVLAHMMALAFFASIGLGIFTSMSDPGFTEAELGTCDWDSEIFREIEEGEVNMSKWDESTFRRASRRTYPCSDLGGRQIKMYDSYAAILDCPVGGNNHRFFWAFMVSLLFTLWSIMYLQFHQSRPSEAAAAAPGAAKSEDLGWVAWAYSFSICHAIGAVLSTADPTGLASTVWAVAWGGAHSFFWSFLVNVPVSALIAFELVLANALINWNATHFETFHKRAETFRAENPLSATTVYSEGAARNWRSFLSGKRQ